MSQEVRHAQCHSQWRICIISSWQSCGMNNVLKIREMNPWLVCTMFMMTQDVDCQFLKGCRSFIKPRLKILRAYSIIRSSIDAVKEQIA